VARAPDEMVERIKREISVQRLVEARGIKLKRGRLAFRSQIVRSRMAQKQGPAFSARRSIAMLR
jgi:hypothetical protein